jgi:hypothetical protein
MERHLTLALPVTERSTLPQADRVRQQEKPSIQRFLRVKPCPIKHLRSLAATGHEKHTAFGPIVCERCHVLPQRADSSWCERCINEAGGNP